MILAIGVLSCGRLRFVCVYCLPFVFVVTCVSVCVGEQHNVVSHHTNTHTQSLTTVSENASRAIIINRDERAIRLWKIDKSASGTRRSMKGREHRLRERERGLRQGRDWQAHRTRLVRPFVAIECPILYAIS